VYVRIVNKQQEREVTSLIACMSHVRKAQTTLYFTVMLTENPKTIHRQSVLYPTVTQLHAALPHHTATNDQKQANTIHTSQSSIHFHLRSSQHKYSLHPSIMLRQTLKVLGITSLLVSVSNLSKIQLLWRARRQTQRLADSVACGLFQEGCSYILLLSTLGSEGLTDCRW
jgi:hypothetical protein